MKSSGSNGDVDLLAVDMRKVFNEKIDRETVERVEGFEPSGSWMESPSPHQATREAAP